MHSPVELIDKKLAGLADFTFFAAMFVLTASVWQTGVTQNLVHDLRIDISGIPVIMMLSAALGFFEFARVGIPLGMLNLLIYWAWFRYGIN